MGFNLRTSSQRKPASVFWKISTLLRVSRWTWIAISPFSLSIKEKINETRNSEKSDPNTEQWLWWFNFPLQSNTGSALCRTEVHWPHLLLSFNLLAEMRCGAGWSNYHSYDFSFSCQYKGPTLQINRLLRILFSFQVSLARVFKLISFEEEWKGRKTNPNNRRSAGPRNQWTVIYLKYRGDKRSYIFPQFDLIIWISPEKSS